MHSHHSHSGQYVEHAKDTLEEVVAEAIRCKMQSFCLTEHMPRLDSRDIYPEEIELGMTVETLAKTFDDYYNHAKRLQRDCSGIKLLVGAEVEHIDSRYYPFIAELRSKYELDMVVGSIHHVRAIPIDYSLDKWIEARNVCGGDLQYFEQYFDDQYEMLQQIRPDVVGHFDLIKLFARHEHCSLDFENLSNYPTIWSKIERNIDYAVNIGSLIEINSAAIRKGWTTPYPSAEIAKLMVTKGAKFCLSDDSHGVAQVALNYHKSAAYLRETLGVNTVYYLEKDHSSGKTLVKSAQLPATLECPVKST